MLRTHLLWLSILALAVSGCSSTRRTEPPRTATEELLISSAVDDALEGLDLGIPPGTRLYVDAGHFEGTDRDYAVGAIRDHLLREGGRLVADRAEANAIVEIRSGALSTNRSEMLVGIPSIDLPIPLTEGARTPELSLVKKAGHEGIAKIGLTIYEAETGALASYSPATPIHGFSYRTRWILLMLIGWTSSDILPDDADD